MAKVWVTEYAGAGADNRGHDVPAPLVPSLRTSVIDITAGAAMMAAAIGDDCGLIAYSGDVAFHIKTTTFASPSLATTGNKRVPANQVHYVTIPRGNPGGLAMSAILAA